MVAVLLRHLGGVVKVLVTGSAGFVGRHLVAACKARGDEVYELDILNGGVHSDARPFFWHHEPWPGCRDLDLVLHCAAYVDGRRGIDGKPAHLHTYNTLLDSAMFNWALRTKPGRVVYFSSSAAYPAWMQEHDAYGPVEQRHRLHEDDISIDAISAPEASYGRVKLHGEQMAADVRAAGVPVTVLRPFSGYGSDQSLDYPFPSIIARAKARQDPFEIWGSGQQVRDWIHIDDIVAATLAAVEQGIDGPVNLCTGTGTTFRELAELVTDYSPEIVTLNDKPAGVDYRVGDPTRLHEFYVPQVKLFEGIQRALLT